MFIVHVTVAYDDMAEGWAGTGKYSISSSRPFRHQRDDFESIAADRICHLVFFVTNTPPNPRARS